MLEEIEDNLICIFCIKCKFTTLIYKGENKVLCPNCIKTKI